MASIQINRGTKAEINNTPITDGMISFQTDDGYIYLDNNNTREAYGGDKIIFNSSETPTDTLDTIEYNGETYGIYSGHDIENQSGTELPRRDAVKISGAYTHDNEDENETVVDIVREMTKAEKDALSNDAINGFQWVTDEDSDFPLTTDDIEYNGDSLTAEIDKLDNMSLEDLSDTDIDTETLEEGQTIGWDSTSEKWVNKDSIKVDNEIIFDSTNPVQSKVIYDFINDLLPEGNESGNPITISDASGLDAKKVKINLEPIQDLSHGDPSPTNICPITGRTEATLTVNGQNITRQYGETIYGGVDNVTDGGMSSEWEIVDLGSIVWTTPSASGISYSSAITDFKQVTTGQIQFGNAVFDNYKFVQSVLYDTDNGKASLYYHTEYSGYRLFVCDTNLIGKTAPQVATYMSGKYICYEVETPTIIETPLTPISLNKGSNTLSTNDGNGSIDLKYSKQLVNNNVLTSLLGLNNNNEEDNNNEET